MGTRSEIYVRGAYATVELWKHWDSYKEFMVPYFKAFAGFADWAVGGNKHWLTYPEDVAAMLIAFNYEAALARVIKFADGRFFEVRPDIRPRGNVNDFEKVWILDLPNDDSLKNLNPTWRVRGYESVLMGDKEAEQMRAVIREGEDPENHKPKQLLKKEVDFNVDPTERRGRQCRMCGYPGPLLVIEDPPICVYCLLSTMRKDDFLKTEVERLFKIAPLIQ